MTLTVVDFVAAGAAALGAGAVNAVAGGGTLISFPALLAIGVPVVPAIVTNTVSLCPGYLSGALTQRGDLTRQRKNLRVLSVAGVAGGAVGSVLLEVAPGSTFRIVVPWLLVLACILLLMQERIREWARSRKSVLVAIEESTAVESEQECDSDRRDGPSWLLVIAVLAGSVYGGFFGAGLGILLLALLGLFSNDGLASINATKQLLSFAINICAAVVFCFTGHVQWQLVPVLAVAAAVGGSLGARIIHKINPKFLRFVVVVFGVAVAVQLWLS